MTDISAKVQGDESEQPTLVTTESRPPRPHRQYLLTHPTPCERRLQQHHPRCELRRSCCHHLSRVPGIHAQAAGEREIANSHGDVAAEVRGSVAMAHLPGAETSAPRMGA